MHKLDSMPETLQLLKNCPKELFYLGDNTLLDRKKISIVGSRKPTKYSRQMTQELASKLSKVGVCVVSGGAMGIDAMAHNGAGSANTIAVLPCGLEHKYPAVNAALLCDIEKKGLLLSQFAPAFRATAWSFVLRNEIVVALGDVLVVSEAELGSGSMRSVEFALAMGKEIYVLPHHIGESSATQKLLEEGKAKAIYDIDTFVAKFGLMEAAHVEEDDFLLFCKTNPNYEELLRKFPQRAFEAELSGEIEVKNAKVFLL
ncbi:MAG: DNA-protecting protein DprA [Sulfurimonas sp.]|nr:DNA-protecting protein DprA [Sulfurimonas sp.]MDD5202163.1 DNA-protecting protein DprA [Sulfurimonas sp.]